MSMRHLMQYLNGAALASIWVFFEHIDKLNYINLQTFNKEIQMVQQQFIIAELSQDSSVITAHITVGNHSHSQAQKSIEQRFNPQRNVLNADEPHELKQQDIRIEDNFNNDANQEEPSYEEDQDDNHSEIIRKPSSKHNLEEDKLEDLHHFDSEPSDDNMYDKDHLDDIKGNMHKELLEDILKEDNDHSNRHQVKPKKQVEQHSEENEYEEVEQKEHESKRHKPAESNEDSRTDNTGDEGSKMNKI